MFRIFERVTAFYVPPANYVPETNGDGSYHKKNKK